jgi:hypothetical protein
VKFVTSQVQQNPLTTDRSVLTLVMLL